MTLPIGPLTKVTVTWHAAPDAVGGDLSARLRGMHFIVGIGPQGLTPFEHLLSGRSAGAEVRFTLSSAEEAAGFFGHLAPAFPHALGLGRELKFVIRIDAVERPDPREVVRALAEATGHGPCDCGCGCGGSASRETPE